MVESLVQWTLLNNSEFLGKALKFNIAKTVGQEITTDFGRIDFILSNPEGNHMVVELETLLDNKSKLDFCLNQILHYKSVSFSPNTEYCILFAEETNKKNYVALENFGRENQVLVRKYSLESAKRLYAQTVERLSLNVGLALPNPKNYTICYLRWLNKILKPFNDAGKPVLTHPEITAPFITEKNSSTNFNCHLRIALDFELIEVTKPHYFLTKHGENFVENISPYVFRASNPSSIDLTNEQKRLLLKILTNGNWENKVHKVNIYWFLRFIEVTHGKWLPKKYAFDQNRLDIANGLFSVSYNGRTMQQFLNWCCNYCLELGLAEKIKSTAEYDGVFLTPLGVEVNNIFSLDLSLKKNRMNLSFKYLV